jgi:hypothetical protein
LGPIAILRLDGDWYESTRICLEHLYDRVVPGGFIILDDYNGVEGCKRATDEFTAARAAKKGLGGNQKIIADTFDQMLGEGLAKPNPGGVGFPDPGQFWCVDMSELRRLSQGKMVASNKRGAFSEAWRALSDQRGLFCAASDLVWRTDRKVKQ